MEALRTFLRTTVSADKRRYQTGNYDLDLTYITDRIIAMAFPSEGVETIYRNNIFDVAKMLNENHHENYMIYNLSLRNYDYNVFSHRVHTWCGFEDHNAPPLPLLFKICSSIYSWLSASPENVAVLHCLAGKGRTGTVIAAFLIYSGLFTTADQALNYFANKRSNTNWGVTNPSQRRSVQYFAQIFNGGVRPSSKPLILKHIILHNIPVFDNGGCRPFFKIYQISDRKRKAIFSSHNIDVNIPKAYSPKEHSSICFDVFIAVTNDILVSFSHLTPIYRTSPVESMFYFCVNIGMMGDGAVFQLPKMMIDDAFKDDRFPPDFYVEIVFGPFDSTQETLTGKTYQENAERLWDSRPPNTSNGEILWFPSDNIQATIEEARALGATSNSVVKAGYLTKQGHTVKNWKLRWFVLKDKSLSYYKSPRDYTKPAGVINLNEILSIKLGETPKELIQNYVELTPNLTESLSEMKVVNNLLTGEQQVWIACSNGYITIWNPHNNSKLLDFRPHQTTVNCICPVGPYVWSSSIDPKEFIIVHKPHIHEPHVVATLPGHSVPIKSILLVRKFQNTKAISTKPKKK